MIRVFYGDDRVKAKQEIRRLLGDDYEVLEGAEISVEDLPSVLMGATLFEAKRRILIRDLMANASVCGELVKYLTTPHGVVIFETKLDKGATSYKELKDKVEFREFKLPENTDFRAVFDIYKVAKNDGGKAVQMLEKVKVSENPIKFTGLMVSQTMKDFIAHQGAEERRALKELARIDLEMKSTKIDPWLIVESFLLRIGSL